MLARENTSDDGKVPRPLNSTIRGLSVMVSLLFMLSSMSINLFVSLGGDARNGEGKINTRNVELD